MRDWHIFVAFAILLIFAVTLSLTADRSLEENYATPRLRCRAQYEERLFALDDRIDALSARSPERPALQEQYEALVREREDACRPPPSF